MTAISRFLRTTILGGAFFLMPVVVLAYLLNKAFDFARRGLKPVAKIIPDQLVSGATMEAIMAIGLIAPLFPRGTVCANPRGSEDHVRTGIRRAVQSSRL
jgi:hypothetical protein